MKKYKYCEKNISKEDQIVQCPDCMNIFHSSCLKERIINTEDVMNVEKTYKSYYYKCPNCNKIIHKY
jgi:uncharacterized C2H2 Zn-finger protein